MVLGSHFFVTPSNSVAVIAANAQAAIPYFKDGLKVGVLGQQGGSIACVNGASAGAAGARELALRQVYASSCALASTGRNSVPDYNFTSSVIMV